MSRKFSLTNRDEFSYFYENKASRSERRRNRDRDRARQDRNFNDWQ